MKRRSWSLALAVMLAVPMVAGAQTTEPAAEDPNTGALTLSGGVDFTTAYFFRGYNQEDTGLIMQPYFTLTAALHSADDYTLNGYIATWNSVQSAQTGAVSGPADWYENDVYGGLDLVMGKFTLGAVYTFYQYPNGAFQTIQEIGFKVGYDDTAMMEKTPVKVALKPYAGVYLETQDGNGSDDTYLELGINPSVPVADGKVTLSFPVVLGCSLDDYYLDSSGDNTFFGYGGISALATVPIPMPAKYGAWSLTAGVQYLCLFADSVEAANNGESNQFIGKVGIAFSY